MKPLFLVALTFTLCAAQQPPAFQLPSDAVPTRYQLTLTLDPQRPEYQGNISIELDVRKPISVVWLNASQLSISSASLEGAANQKAQILAGGDDFVGLEFARPLAPGRAHLTIHFSAKVNTTSAAGVFLGKRNEDRYLFTQFEPTDARSAFPCFDEPSYKVPWQVTLHVPASDVAVSNTSIQSENPEGTMKTVVFRETKPLPSYLIAFAVGPLEFVDAGRAGRAKVPVRIVVPRGDAPRAKYAAAVTAEILTKLEDYFGIPYPFDKADQLSIPLSFGGAMENPGLVTYDARIILSPSQGEDTLKRERGYASVAAHELAHQWFGDLVTMAWWNDTWLNESFATFMEAKLLNVWKPEWQPDVEEQTTRTEAMWMDRLASARRIDQPVTQKNEIASAFDGITYLKGGSVLTMFDHSLGEGKFRQAVRMYLNKHAGANGTTADFLDALREMGGPEVPASFKTFLQQPGTPEIGMQLRCENGHARIEMTQERFRPVGSAGLADQTWKVPVCVSYAVRGEHRRECSTLSEKSSSFPLSGKGCPSWFLGNSDEVGYYYTKYEASALQTLIANRTELSLSEQVGLLNDLHNMSRAGRVQPSETLALAAQLRDDPRRQIAGTALQLATVDWHLIPEDLRPRYVNYVQETFGPRARRLGWSPKQGDTEDDRFLRAQLVPFVATDGEDAELIAEAKRMTEEWLEERAALPRDTLASIFAVAARNGDATLNDKFVAAVKGEKEAFFQSALFAALGSFRRREIVEKNLQRLFAGEFDWRLAFPLLLRPQRNPEVAQLPLQFVKANFDKVISKLPSTAGSNYGSFLPMTAEAGCSSTAAEDAEAFFGSRMNSVSGGPRALAHVVEGIKLCEALKKVQEPDIANFFH